MNMTNIRNFAIVAHIDHGKSTLSDRFLEITGTISKEKIGKQEQFLDQNPISRERGITIKLAPVRMTYILNSMPYTLNLIDTPGHVDFSYEVSRTLAACEGVILLVDATKGVQAQTIAHLKAARKLNLVIIPVINKIDMPAAFSDKVAKQLEILGFERSEILFISAKTGENTEKLLQTIIEKIPPPFGFLDKPLKALVFDAVYDEHRGVVTFVRIIDGKIKTNDAIEFFQTQTKTNGIEIGFFAPNLTACDTLTAGEIGYIVTSVKDIKLCRVGDTIRNYELKIKNNEFMPLPGYDVPKPMVFFGIYPTSTDELTPLREALQRLALIDTSLTFHSEYSNFLGSGFRVGFLGLLHADILRERLIKEFNLEPLFTLPNVSYQKLDNGLFQEPYMDLMIHVPQTYLGNVMTVCQKKRGKLINIEYQDENVVLIYDMPYSMFLKGLSSDLNSVSSGFVSIDYELTTYKDADLIKLEVLINQKPIDVLSEYVYIDEAQFIAREKAKKLKESLSKQQYSQIIQVVDGGKVLAREEISPFRKDVLAKMSGGDRTRKDKLLEAQKKGKKKMFSVSKIEIPQEALFKMISS